MGLNPGRDRRFFSSPKCLTRIWQQHGLLFSGHQELFFWGYSSQGVRLTTDIHLGLRIRTSGAKLSLLLYVFMTHTGTLHSSKCWLSFEFLHFVVIECSDFWRNQLPHCSDWLNSVRMVKSTKERAILRSLNSHWLRTALTSLHAFCSCDWQNVLEPFHITNTALPLCHLCNHLNISATLKMEAIHSYETPEHLTTKWYINTHVNSKEFTQYTTNFDL